MNGELDMDPRILNVGLHLAMEFGENWLRPIQQRLAVAFGTLTPDELDTYDRICRQTMAFGEQQVRLRWKEAAGNETEAYRLFKIAVLDQYPWVTDGNLSRLFTQGCYYAYKDGELP
jgi:hypothetical protein